ncbi:MAG: rhodanese-like domain-containing protein [Holophaga sp.]|nr:rhodanese-like domain-containing protein [Holophaga sp.]
METSTLIIGGVGIAVAMLVLRTIFSNRSKLSKDQLMTLLDQGTVILDVRTPQEFAQGHVPESRNIPLDTLSSHFAKLDRTKPILVCCASGARSGAAKAMLEKAGFTRVENEGPWQRLMCH